VMSCSGRLALLAGVDEDGQELTGTGPA
jgi:hypothetical protein